MIDDADRLLADFGADARAVAADRSWREDVGLLKTDDPGHWSRVTIELGRRLARAEHPRRPMAEASAALRAVTAS